MQEVEPGSFSHLPLLLLCSDTADQNAECTWAQECSLKYFPLWFQKGILLWYRMYHTHFIYRGSHKTTDSVEYMAFLRTRPGGAGFIHCMVRKLMNECSDLTAMHDAPDGWACFDLITDFTRGLREAVNQGPHYKSCRLRRVSSHPHLMSQQILPLCCLRVSWELKRSAAFYCQVKLFRFIYLFQIAHKPI